MVIIGHKVEADLLYKDSGDPKLFINVYANLVKSYIYFWKTEEADSKVAIFYSF